MEIKSPLHSCIRMGGISPQLVELATRTATVMIGHLPGTELQKGHDKEQGRHTHWPDFSAYLRRSTSTKASCNSQISLVREATLSASSLERAS